MQCLWIVYSGALMAKISVIIPALNEGKYLKGTLESLSAQSFKDFETILVDGGSSDNTCRLARTYAKIIKQPMRGISLARNTGALNAKGSILFFTDADTAVGKDTLMNIYNTFSDKSVAVVTGPILPREKVGLTIRLLYTINYKSMVKFSMLIGKPSFVGSNIAIRRSVFNRIRGFNTMYNTYEDCDMTIRAAAAGKAAYIDGIKVYSSARRMLKWGIARYLSYTIPNMLNFYFHGRPSDDYEPIR